MKDLKSQFVSALLFILTVAAVSCAIINFRQQSQFHLPDDGVTWVDRAGKENPPVGQVVALYVEKGKGAENAGIRQGDVLVRIGALSIRKAVDVPEALTHFALWSTVRYTYRRNGMEAEAPVILGESIPDSAIDYQYAVGFLYLLIGLFVLIRRAEAPRAVHFFLLCLASFILCCFHYTAKLNPFDKVIYWGNVTAGLLAPTLFLHFCLVFPERPRWLTVGPRWIPRIALAYVPAAFLLTLYGLVALGILRVAEPLVEVRWFLDRVWMLYLICAYLAGALALISQSRHAEDPLVRRQLKYLRYGALLGVIPFSLAYALPYVAGAVPSHYQKMAVLSLAFIPVTWAYAILRYRLMDVDIIFQQGYVYTLATLCVLGIFYGLILSFTHPEELGPAAIVGLILFATFIFQPIRAWLQEVLDRYFFYKDKYEKRRTLVEFARELGSETNLEHMLGEVGQRIIDALSIQHMGFFLADETLEQFRLHLTLGSKRERHHGRGHDELDLSFLAEHSDEPYLFFERTRHLLDVVSHKWPRSVRATIADLDLTYFLPCKVRGRTIAWVGLSRTDKGDFLSSDDVELLFTICGYVGIAIENGRLYSSLQRKVEAYERLKEFSENIVESINVGILAADLDDRVESWNSQIEKLTGIARNEAVGRRLSDLFPRELNEKFNQVRGQTGIHNIYKFVLQPDLPGVRQRAGNGTNGAPKVQARRPHPEPRHRAAGLQGFPADRTPDHLRRYHRPRRTRAQACAGR